MEWKLTPEEEKDYEMIRLLEYIHEHVNAIENVYYREHSCKSLYPTYIIEKLDTCQKIIDMEKEYWRSKMNE